MSNVTDQAVVIRLVEFAETSQVLGFFTRNAGQVRLIAKGIKRGTKTRFATGVDLLELGELSYIPARGEAGLGILTGWVQRESFTGLRRDLSRLYGGMYMAELVAALTQEFDPHADVFDALVETLSDLSESPDFSSQRDSTGKSGDSAPAASNTRTAQTLVNFQLALLKSIGYLPEFSRCMSCGRPPISSEGQYFSSSAGGVICRDCELHYVEKRTIPVEIAGSDPSSSNPAAWLSVLNYHLMHVAGRPFRTSDKVLTAIATIDR